MCHSLLIKKKKKVAYSPLALGALSGKYSPDRLPPGPRGFVIGQVLSGCRELTGTVDEIARERGKTSAQVALAWTMSKGTLPIVGVRSVSQVNNVN
ncbi:NADP-dependent oxidoreductase domain-containing protein [Pavlovales sp. CCMP2436]|nr:NADP-dependent oxidoreductase domain-containing protein [Pavlovales sp. CCMP2436]